MVGLFDFVRLSFVKFRKTDIVRVFSLTALSTLVRMLTGLISVKVVAVIIGPSGIALLGQLNNFSTIIMNLASLGINQGVTKFVSQHKKEENALKKFISTAFRITLLSSVVCGLFMIVFHRFLSRVIMLSDEYGDVFVIFGFTVGMYALNNLLLSILNGYKEFKLYVSISIISTLVGLVFTVSLVLLLGLKGALISSVTFQSVMLFITLWMLRKFPWLSREFFRLRSDKATVRKYLGFAVMTLVSIAVVPVSQMILRGHIITHISDVQAGWWEAMNRISAMYLLVITSSFGVYYLPRLSEIDNPKELRHEILKAYKVIMPLLLVGFVFVYYARFLIIRILFAPDFAPMENLFIWQLAGDLFKVAGWLLAFLMLAKAMIKTYVVTEIVGGVLYVVLAFVFMRWNGVVGIVQAYLLNYVIYTLLMVGIFRKIILYKQK